jgi:hypothetical protein
MSRHPVDGVKGSKPRFPGAEKAENGPSKAELSRLNREYLISRNRTQRQGAGRGGRERRKAGTLISRKLVGMQSAYLLTVFRQRALLAPAAIARRLANLALVDPAKEHAVSEAVREDIHILLTELSHLPAQVVDPNWFEKIEPDFRAQVAGAGPLEPRAPVEARAQAEKAEVRNKKVETSASYAEGRA